ncbi:hypothetical protein QQ045_015793 [Rhodiola kirilowii]
MSWDARISHSKISRYQPQKKALTRMGFTSVGQRESTYQTQPSKQETTAYLLVTAANVYIEKVTCGPGHGISVGSLGKYKNEEDVIGITVKNCTLSNTQNGMRIKTWPASEPGTASDMHFEDIILNNVSNPVLIDQEFCPWNQCTLGVPSKVRISKVSFKNIRGTTATREAVKLICSKGIPCQNVEVGDIDLKYSGLEGPAIAVCKNLKPTILGKLFPDGCKLREMSFIQTLY